MKELTEKQKVDVRYMLKTLPKLSLLQIYNLFYFDYLQENFFPSTKCTTGKCNINFLENECLFRDMSTYNTYYFNFLYYFFRVYNLMLDSKKLSDFNYDFFLAEKYFLFFNLENRQYINNRFFIEGDNFDHIKFNINFINLINYDFFFSFKTFFSNIEKFIYLLSEEQKFI